MTSKNVFPRCLLGPLFGGHIPSSFWNNCNICYFGTQGFLAFCHYEAYLFVFPLQNVDLDKHISPRRSESNPPPFSVKWNPGLHRHICVRLQSSVEKWSQKKFLRAAKPREKPLAQSGFKSPCSLNFDHFYRIIFKPITAKIPYCEHVD